MDHMIMKITSSHICTICCMSSSAISVPIDISAAVLTWSSKAGLKIEDKSIDLAFSLIPNQSKIFIYN